MKTLKSAIGASDINDAVCGYVRLFRMSVIRPVAGGEENAILFIQKPQFIVGSTTYSDWGGYFVENT